jgi:lipopolysaccharide/colanic/teichoic acid biosynthesis glycosyltransferase
MVVGADGSGPGITAAGDPRVTALGARLRRLKFDELPQLWNVFKGDMSLVGPRPELPLYVESYNSSQQKIVRVRPGLTDRASIDFRWEEELLAQCVDPQQFYREKVLPRKLALNLEYIEKISLKNDLLLICGTVRSLLSAPTDNNPIP